MTHVPPKAFVSYSWSSPEHIEWVKSLVNELAANGVDAQLDKFHLREGQDANAFMERMVNDDTITKVILVCDRIYTEKANHRKGGVGTEAQIISTEVYKQKSETAKFVAVLRERDENGAPYVPTYYGSRIYIDLTEGPEYSEQFDRLLRWLYEKPLDVRNPLGEMPAFLRDESPQTSLGLTIEHRRATEALRSGATTAPGNVTAYLAAFARSLERFRIEKLEGKPLQKPLDDLVVESIETLKPALHDAITLFDAIALYGDTGQYAPKLRKFFESLVPYFYKPDGVRSYSEEDYDNFRFFGHELFLHAIVACLTHEKLEFAGALFKDTYYCPSPNVRDQSIPPNFTMLDAPMNSFELRKARLKSNRTSLVGDLLLERLSGTGIERRRLKEASFLAYLRSELMGREHGYVGWYPYAIFHTTYGEVPHEVFARATSKRYFARLLDMLGISEKRELASHIEAMKQNSNFRTNVPPLDVIVGLEQLGTKP